MPDQSNRWYPTKGQLDEARNPGSLERSIRQILKQHYDLVDRFEAYRAANPPRQATKESPFPAGSGPTDSYLLGVPVQPIDTATLTNGATLKWNKSTGTFIFS